MEIKAGTEQIKTVKWINVYGFWGYDINSGMADPLVSNVMSVYICCL